MAEKQRSSGWGGYAAVAALALFVGRWTAPSADTSGAARSVSFTSSPAEYGQAEHTRPGVEPTASTSPDGEVSQSDQIDSGVDESDEPERVYYARCADARAAGAAPIHVGEPGYGSHLDRDGDGVACE